MKKIKNKRLSADERPLFAPWNAVHKSKKDKAATRQNRKKQLKEDMKNYDE